jgi:uncharacterized protein (TIGR02246 family)
MPRFHAWVAVVVVGAVAGGSWVYAQRSAGASGRLSGADVAEIQQLHSRYNQGWDFRDVELYLSAYTDDAVFTTGAGEAYAGKRAITDYLTSSFAKGVSGDVTHNNTSVLITPTAEGARGRVYWYTINVLTQPPAIAGAGHYEDTYVKTADGWRMKSRKSTRGWPRRGPTTAAAAAR